jgi:hypothetical protein
MILNLTKNRTLTSWGGGSQEEYTSSRPPNTTTFVHLQLKQVRLQYLELHHKKMHLLRCVHKVHAPRIMREFIPCLIMPLAALLTLSHQLWKEVSVGCGEKAWVLCEKKRNQNSLAETQRTKRWSMVSTAWSHRGQHSGWGSPRRASQSAVQHRLWAITTIQRSGIWVVPMSSKLFPTTQKV